MRVRGFSLPEMAVAVLIFALITAGSTIAYNRLARQQNQSTVQAEQRTQGNIVDKILGNDIENATYLSGSTAAGTLFPAGTPVKTFGVLPYPFNDPSTQNPVRISDGIEIFVIDTSLSLSSLYSVTNVVASGGGSSVTVSGDFSALQTLSEDLFVMTGSTGIRELFQIDGAINVSGSGAGATSTFVTTVAVPSSITSLIGSNANPSIYRVQKVRYQVGNGSETRGLYRIRNGVTELVAADVASMQISYGLSSENTDHVADCTTKDSSRYFAHGTLSTQCTWGDVRSVQVQMVFETENDMGVAYNANPHLPNVSDGKIRTLVHIFKTLENYRDVT